MGFKGSFNRNYLRMKILMTQNQAGKMIFIPYFAWDNREPGKMKVWINYEKQNSLYN
jgi:DUF1680 family protein